MMGRPYLSPHMMMETSLHYMQRCGILTARDTLAPTVSRCLNKKLGNLVTSLLQANYGSQVGIQTHVTVHCACTRSSFQMNNIPTTLSPMVATNAALNGVERTPSLLART